VATHCLDTSALVKRYLPEVGSVWVASLCEQEPIVTSLIAVTELASAKDFQTWAVQTAS